MSMQERQMKMRRVSISLIYDRLSLVFFGGVARSLARAFELNRLFEEAGLYVHPVMYMAKVLMTAFLALIISASLGMLLYMLRPSILVLVVAVLLSAVSPLAVFIVGLAIPYVKRSGRGQSVRFELPYFAVYMTVMAIGGLSPERILEKISQIKLFRAIRFEAQRILRDIRIFGLNPLSAFERNAYRHPCREYSELILGYTTTVRTGGDIIHYLETKTSELFDKFAEHLKGVSERIGLLAEAYVTMVLIGGIALYIFLTVTSLMRGASVGAQFVQIAVFSYIVMPAITIIMLFIIDSMLPKQPIYPKEQYIAALLVAPAAIAIIILSMMASGAVKTIVTGEGKEQGVAMAIMCLVAGILVFGIPTSIADIKVGRRLAGLHRQLAAFLRDLAEARKTGLSPEKCIIMLSERDYGKLTPVIRRMAGALIAGLPVEQAARHALAGTRDWFILVNLRILVDAMDFGGGTPTMLDIMANYIARLVQMLTELRMRLKLHIVLPYFGAILMTLATLMTAASLFKASALIGGQGTAVTTVAIPEAVYYQFLALTTTGIIIDSWFIGLVAGKLHTGRLSTGFIHSTLLALISAIAAIAYLLGLLPTI